MVTVLSGDGSDAKRISDERASIVSSAKMHFSIFQAQVLYLGETGTLPKEISEMTSTINDIFQDRSAVKIPPKSKLAIEHCNPPCRMSVKEDYYPGTHQGVVAQCGDDVVVYAWAENRTEAVVYNARNWTSGRIPTNLLDTSKTELVHQDRLYMATSNQRATLIGYIPWKAGDYIRVWDRVNGLNSCCSGFCFNLASGQIGKFSTVTPFLELVD